MHYSVLVLGEDVEGQLAPYSESLTSPAWSTASEDFHRELIRIHGSAYIQGAEDEALKDGFEHIQIRKDGLVELGATFNPDGRWDWWAWGGRWSGVLPTEPEHLESETHSAGVSSSSLGDVIWNEDTLKLIHSVVLDGTWYDLDHGTVSKEPEKSRVQQLKDMTVNLPETTSVHVIDCHC